MVWEVQQQGLPCQCSTKIEQGWYMLSESSQESWTTAAAVLLPASYCRAVLNRHTGRPGEGPKSWSGALFMSLSILKPLKDDGLEGA